MFYWRGKAEVDFVVQTAKGLTPVQVTLKETLHRHEKGLAEFYEQFPHAVEAVHVNLKNFEQLLRIF